MSKEKSLGQVAFEADRSDFMGEFKDLPAYLKTNEETKAKAVIDEFLRRNGEPVAWRWKYQHEDRKEDKLSGLVYGYSTRPVPFDAEPLFAAPQPLPNKD